MDARAIKAREHETWKSVAPGWKKHDKRLSEDTRVVVDRMLDAARVSAGHRVLDVACGTGFPAIPAAERVGPSGSVLATDLVEEMLAVAREKAAAKGLANIEFRRADAEELDVPDASFDAALSRWGIMFMPDPVACLRRVHRALKSGGRVAFTAWAGPERNLWASFPMAVLPRYMELPTPPPGAPGPFAFGDPERSRSVLREAGFDDVEVDEVKFVNGRAKEASTIIDQMFDMAGPIAMLIRELPEDTQQKVRADLVTEIEKLREGTDIVLPAVTWLAHARR